MHSLANRAGSSPAESEEICAAASVAFDRDQARLNAFASAHDRPDAGHGDPRLGSSRCTNFEWPHGAARQACQQLRAKKFARPIESKTLN
jgi:hypothetical protein